MKKTISIFLCIALLLSFAVTTAAEGKISATPVSGYTEVARNSSNVLYVDSQTGNISVYNIASGKTWYSVPEDVESDTNTVGIEQTNIRSTVAVDFFYTEDEKGSDKPDTSNTATECKSGVTVENIDNGVRVTYDMSYLELTIPVEFVLDGDAFKASIIYDDIKEGEYCRITSIKLLPAFGAAGLNESGYLVIPDGSGAVINFNNGVGANEYISEVYGSEIDTLTFRSINQAETVRMPMFGIVKGDCALLGVIEKGDDSATLCAYSAYPGKYGYSAASSKALYRKNSQISMFGSDFANHNTINSWVKCADTDKYTVSYYFLGAGNASFAGIGRAYQDYLLKNGSLNKSEDKPSMHLDVYNSISTTTAFLGFKYQKQTALTTYAQTEKIIDELKSNGVNSISARLIGWSNTGVDNKKLPTNIKYLGTLGGESKFGSLMKLSSDEGISVTPNVDLCYAQKQKSSQILKTFFNKPIYKYNYSNSVYMQIKSTKTLLSNAKTVASTAKSFLSKYKKIEAETVSLGSLGNYCYTNFSSKNFQSRGEMISAACKVMKNYADAGYKLTLESANAYAFKYADTITKSPMASSGYEIFDYDIPLYQIVLHGYVTVTTDSIPQATDKQDAYLFAVTTGTEPMYSTFYKDADVLQETDYGYLYSSTFSWWKDEAVGKYKQYEKLLGNIYNVGIAQYIVLTKDVVKTVFDNGITVYVNYGENDYTLDDGTVAAAQSYIWVGGENA